MFSERFPSKAMKVALPVLCLFVAMTAYAGEPEDALAEGIRLFEEGKYLEANEVLLGIDRDDLSDADQARRDEYLERVQAALVMVDKANKSLEDGERALEAGDLGAAEEHLEAVLDNEYAPQGVRKHAQSLLDDVARQRESERDDDEVVELIEVVEETPPDTPLQPAGAARQGRSDADAAATFVRQGYDALAEGNDDEAYRLFQEALLLVPGHPDATNGIEQVRQYKLVEEGSGSILNRMRIRDQIRWQRAVSAYREIEREIREHVMEERFDLARDALLIARQTIEAGRQYASPLSQYEALQQDLNLLDAFVADEERTATETLVRIQREEIEREREARIDRMRDAKGREVEALWEQAYTHRKDGDWKSAISVVKQIVALDPSDRSASFTLDDWEDIYELRRQRKFLNDRNKGIQTVLTEVDAAKVPVGTEELVKYPDDWLEKIKSMDRVPSGAERMSEEDQELREKLDKKIPVNFEDQPFEDVLDELAETQGVNITVVWNDVEAVGIRRDDPVTLRLTSEVTFEKVLELILSQIGGADDVAELDFVAAEGVIKIATKDLLNEEVYTDVYDVNDLLMTVPDYNGPDVSFGGGGGGGGFGGGGGGGIGGGGGGFGGGGGGFGGGGGGGLGGGGGGFSGGFNQNVMNHPQFGGGGGGFGGGGGGFGGGGGGFGGGGGGGNDEADREERIEDLLELIRETIEPDSWREAGGEVAAVVEFSGQLVVTQTASAHGQIADLLEKLRAQRAIQVAVETRFLTVIANYLEEIGIDLDIILNQGNAGYDLAAGDNGPLVGPYGETVLLPREFSRMGFTPGIPGVGSQMTQQTLVQPYGTVASVPPPGRGMSWNNNTPIPIISNILDITAPVATSVDGSFGGGAIQPALQMFGSFLDGIQVDFLLRATQADRRNSIMNWRLRLVLFNGQQAYVAVINQTAYVQSVEVVTDQGAVGLEPQAGQLLTGAALRVRATVSADKRYVTMNLTPTVSELVGLLTLPTSGGAAGGAANNSFIQLPSTQVQIIRTTVTVPDGGTLLFGGMKKTGEIDIEAGVPVLSKLPVLKRLYSNRSLVKDESVLLILVKPSIVIQKESEREAFPTFSEIDS